MDPEIDAQLTEEVANALRASGHEGLLLRYAAALQWFNHTRAALERANAEGQINEVAQHAMNDALEDFERVEVDVLAMFHHLEEERQR